jgi:hypothetical protein
MTLDILAEDDAQYRWHERSDEQHRTGHVHDLPWAGTVTVPPRPTLATLKVESRTNRTGGIGGGQVHNTRRVCCVTANDFLAMAMAVRSAAGRPRS